CLWLMFALTASGGSPAVGEGVIIGPTPSPTAGLQSPIQPAKDQKQEGGSVVEKDDLPVILAFTLLVECCLPNGTRLTSGFRTANDQLAVIRHYAQAEGLQFPANMRVDKPETWRLTLAKLRERGYVIADPDKTPHSSEDLIVFDLAGADQNAIEAAVRRAERDKGLVKIERIIREGPRQAVHVELSLTQRGLQELNLRRAASATEAPQGNSEGKKAGLRNLQDLHDRAKDNPARQIDLDYLMLDFLDPADFADRARLKDEIKTHEQELDKIKQDGVKKVIYDKINAAERNDQLEEALQIARKGSSQFPELQGMASRFEAMVKINFAKEIFFTRNCEEAETARESLAQARQIDSSNQLAARLEKEINSWSSRCSSSIYFWIAFAILAVAGALAALYFFFRPGYWELKCVDGPCKGETYSLDAPEILIGAVQGEADVVIDDRKRRISRRHCLIWREKRDFYIIDESANGTFVNGQPVSKESGQLLRNKSEISLAGAATLIFQRSAGGGRKAE
ncbi:MAG TPA: FHA domain-containing protein, partial [Blastocatellia bacterium]|nr:FHA domain-containing protein [Blastocatellia bacterium]